MTTKPSRAVGWPVQMLTVALIWGASFMFIKVELDDDIAPVHIAWLRCVFGAGALLIVLRARGESFPSDRRLLGHLVVIGALMNGLPFLLFAYGETKVASLLAGILNATTPLLTLMFSLVILPGERPTRRKGAGLLLGFSGVLVVLAPWDGLGHSSLIGALACVGASTCYGIGFPYMRRNLGGRSESALAISAAQVSIGALLLTPVAFLGTLPEATPGLDSFGSILAIGCLGTGAAYVMNLNVIRIAGAQTASTVTYIVPIFAVLFGALVLSESVSWHEPAGGAIILAGVTLANRRSLNTMATEEKAILAGGCFWGVEDLVRKLDGVTGTRVGYTGGDVENATYRNHGKHAEGIEILFDPDRISYRDILEFFFQIHDPSTKNRQGNDRGSSYRSAIYYVDEEQHRVALDTIADVDASGLWPGKVVTEVEPAGPFWEAEPEHQDYLLNYPNGYTCHYVRPGWKLPRREQQPAGTS